MSELNEALGLQSEEKGNQPDKDNSEKVAADGEEQGDSSMPTAVKFSIAFYILAAIFVVAGFMAAYQDSSYGNKVVGGDAYNYIIFAGRGMVWMGAAIVTALGGLACQLAGNAVRLRETMLSELRHQQ